MYKYVYIYVHIWTWIANFRSSVLLCRTPSIVVYTYEFLLVSADQNSKKPVIACYLIAEIWYYSKAILLNVDTLRGKETLHWPKPEIFLTLNVTWLKGNLHGAGSLSMLHPCLFMAGFWVEWCWWQTTVKTFLKKI